LLVGYVFWLNVLWNLGIFRAIGDVRTVASIEYLDTIAKVSDVFGGFCFELFVVEFESFFECDGMRIFRLDADE
jgi:hypothetical protein